MPRKGKRIRVSKGVFRDSGGYEVRVTVGGSTYYARMPSDSTLEELKAKRAELEDAGRSETPRAERGTLRADAKRYLKLVAHLASIDDREDHLDAWCELFGDVYRHRLSQSDVLTARVRWLTTGRPERPRNGTRRHHRGPLSPKTINHYCGTLRNLYHVLDGARARTPVDDVPDLPVSDTPIRRVPESVMLAVDQRLQAFEQSGRLRNAKQRARYRVLITCGKRHIEIMRAQPGDVDLERRVWVIRDAKGGYTPGGIYLNDDMRAAWQLFIDAEAWGPFSHGSFTRILRAAGWPEGVVVYQARHNTWIAASERGADLSDIAAGAGHRDLRLTRKRYVPVLNSRMQQLSERLEGRFQGWPVVRESIPDRKPLRKR